MSRASGSLVGHNFTSFDGAVRSTWKLSAFYLILNTWNEWLRGFNDGVQDIRSFSSEASVHLVLVEVIKLCLSLAYSLWQSKWRLSQYASTGPYHSDEEANVASDPTDSLRLYSHGHESPRGSVEGMVAILDMYLVLSCGTLCTLLLSHLMLLQSFPAIQWHAAILQSCGFLMLQMWLVLHVSAHIPYPIFIGAVFSRSLSSVICKHLYITHGSIPWYSLNNALFAFGAIIRLLSYSFSDATEPFWVALGSHPLRTLITCGTAATAELSRIVAIYYWDPATEGILSSTSTAVYVLFVSSWAGNSWLGVVLGCFIVISACAIYVLYQSDTNDEQRHGKPWFPFRRTASGAVLLSAVFYLAFTASHEWGSALHRTGRPTSVGDLVVTSPSRCVRRPLASWTYWPDERTFHAFDNVLLIVFFSHARYDANLDFYREVYSQFFPNIVFVGPGTREDKGFQHSYDVLVDSYESDEDLSDPAFYKMAGRMAHHMLFTAMKEYDCYDGYLWAPFDTLLNVPRLQLFDQRYFWYHSPAATYVPNPALGDSVAGANASRHAPPANISPDPYLDLSSAWKGWVQDWCDPHVGLSVCIPAFHRVPPPLREQLRERLDPYTNSTTRLIGGSADTLYIPGKHRQTHCFLEIATPTVEPILFVDHWWIWQPPFNASYGYEVDTFHTFHWGDRDSTGAWRGNPAHIADVRALLGESARRQGVEWPWTSTVPVTAGTPRSTP
ncbi:uncharacterized protein B0H18DRAFT_973121 [Fomitopsis serialis]|uniref:uncharacterized protein n=1 Tax=Fomitopsis serialis TaxID=139415 RepID=UPI002007AA41|nr:uncharacterized protein B0H18DRAFT_973121 [Neoantrodia serialis]KAH9936270.1 hypothetical protein B0H18DRAFT_973121 [Neoantrodia serialis]